MTSKTCLFASLMFTVFLAGCVPSALAPVVNATNTSAPVPTDHPTAAPPPTVTPAPTLSPSALTASIVANLHEISQIPVETRLFGVDISPDHSQVAAGTLGGEILVYSLPSGELLRVLDRHDGRVYRILYSPDGSRLYSASRDGSVQVWDAASGERLFAVRTPREASALAIIPDGSAFAAGGYYSARGMVWDSREGAPIAALEGHQTRFRSLAYSTDGTMLATGDFDGIVILRDTVWYEKLGSFDFEWGEAASLAFSPEGNTLAVGMSQTHLFLFDLDVLAIRADLMAHGGSVNDLMYTPDGSLLISAGVDGDIGFWDAVTGENLRYIATGGGSINDLALTADGEMMATAGEDGVIRIYAIMP